MDVKHLAIALRFDWQQKQAYGTTVITLSPLQSTSTIALDAGMLTIQSITLENGTPLTFTYDGGDRDDGLVIRLDRSYPAKAELRVTITYRTAWKNRSDPNSLSGSDGKGIRFFAPTSTEPVKRRQIWSVGWPASNRYWFPGHDAPDDLRTTDFTATVEQPLTVISNGSLVEARTNADGTRSFHWKVERPYANHLTSFVIGEYTDVVQESAGVPLHSYGYPDERDAVEATVVRLPDMVRFFSDVTGMPFPQPGYSQVFVQDLPWGWGNIGAATLTENMVDDYRTHADWRYLWDGLEAEALAHQWFGASLSPREWSDAWLSRGFSRYFDGLYNEHKNGREEFLLWQQSGDLGTALGDWHAGTRHPIVTRDRGKALEFASDNFPYFRGALVLHMLRKHLGEENWWKAIRQYVSANAGRTVTTDDFRRVVEKASGESLGWFFDQWLYGIGHPVFEITTNYDAARKLLILRARQVQQPDAKSEYPQTKFFAGAVDIEIDDRIERVWLKPRAENVFSFAASQPPALVNFDYESTWIKEIRFAKPLAELLYQAQHDRDVLGRRWAMRELAGLGGDSTTSREDREKIYAGFRQVALSDSYWRLRIGAIAWLQSLLAPAAETRPVPLDAATTTMLLRIIRDDKSWVRAAAISFLGMTRDQEYVDIYRDAMTEESHQVIYAAAQALGKSGSPRAFETLVALMQVPSWKGENRLSALLGLKELGDPRGAEVALAAVTDQASPRWTLATSRWDYRIAGVETLVALGKGEMAFPVILERFRKSVEEEDVNDMFSNALLIATLGDPRGQEVFDVLRVKFAGDANAMTAVEGYETQFKEALAQR